MACVLLWSSAVRDHDSQAYRKMDVTKERISRYLGTERNTPVIPNWFQPCKCCCCQCYPGEYLGLGIVTSFKYLGSVITDEGSKPEILSRIAQTIAAVTRLKPVWNDTSISLSSLAHPSSFMRVNHGPSQQSSKEEHKPWK